MRHSDEFSTVLLKSSDTIAGTKVAVTDVSAAFSKSEMMIVAAAHALGGQGVCFVGVGLPNIAVNLAQRTEAAAFSGSVLATAATVETFRDELGGFRFAPIHVKGRAQPVRVISIRVLRTHRGTLATIPGVLEIAGAEEVALLVQAHGSGKHQRLTVKARAEPGRGEPVEFAACLPEHPEPLSFRGRAISTSPLLDRDAGRSIDIMVDEIDPDLAALLEAEGPRPAPVQLEAIPRSGEPEEAA